MTAPTPIDTDSDRDSRPSTRESGLTDIDTLDGRITGLSYVADFRFEEEQGSRELRRIFSRVSRPTSFQRSIEELDPGYTPDRTLRTQSDYMILGEDFVAFTTEPAASMYRSGREVDTALRYIAEQTPYTQTRISLWKYQYMTVPELRALAKARGLSLTSRARKGDLVKAVSESTPRHPEEHPPRVAPPRKHAGPAPRYR